MNKIIFSVGLLMALWACDRPAQQNEAESSAPVEAQENHAADAPHSDPPIHQQKTSPAAPAQKAHGGGHDANAHMNSRSFEELVADFENPERNSWQMPVEVIDQLGSVREKTVIDIGCGTGYFAFPLAVAGANVICADVDERFQNYVARKKAGKVENGDKIELRKLTYDDPGLSGEEVDMALVVNTYHHITNRVAYFAKVHAGIKTGGKLVIIDFMKDNTPMGPPIEMRMTEDEVIRELNESGFTDMQVMGGGSMLPYQYVIIARK